MSTALAERQTGQLDAKAIEQVMIGGDLSKLTADQRLSYYQSMCASLGLNPMTKPFAYLQLSGKTVLYALKDATEQLRKIHGVSISEVTSQQIGDVFVVTAKAQDKTGRTDAATGAVPIANLKGEALANALMKAETKAKRRVTLSICGLGMLDETELETIPNARTGDSLPPVIVEAEVSATDPLPEPPEGAVYLRKSEQRETSKGRPYWLLLTQQGEELVAWDQPFGALAEQAVQDKEAVVITTKGVWDSKAVVKGIRQAGAAVAPLPELKAEDIAF